MTPISRKPSRTTNATTTTHHPLEARTYLYTSLTITINVSESGTPELIYRTWLPPSPGFMVTNHSGIPRFPAGDRRFFSRSRGSNYSRGTCTYCTCSTWVRDISLKTLSLPDISWIIDFRTEALCGVRILYGLFSFRSFVFRRRGMFYVCGCRF